jgi:tetratricopeptide (TPR) repeat protein
MSKPDRSVPLNRVGRRRSWFALVTIVIAVGCLGGISIWFFAVRQTESPESDLVAAAEALQQSRFEDAGRLSHRVLEFRPTDQKALLIAARSAAAGNDFPKAFALCDRLHDSERRAAVRNLFSKGEAMVRAGQARRAEETLRLTLHLNPNHLDATFILAFLLGAEGRAWEAAPLTRKLIEANRFDIPQLKLVAATEDFFILQTRFVNECRAAVPDDPLPLLAVARDALFKNDSDEAEAILRRILEFDPSQIEAQARWGRWLYEHRGIAPLRAWQHGLPRDADDHPDIWVTRGLYALQTKQNLAAIRCFAETARRDSNHRIAHQNLGQLLAKDNPELAAKFQHRAELLSELSVPLLTFNQRTDPALVRRVAELCEALGHPREAVAWAELGLRGGMNVEWATAFVAQIQDRYAGHPPWVLEEAQLANQVDLSAFPLPTWDAVPEDNPSSETENSANPSEIRFREDSAAIGIQFRFYNDSTAADNPLRMFEFTGGGLGVIDYDGDGWPDLYASQGSRFPEEPNPPVHLDRLFQNNGDGQFRDVTLASGLGDSRFSAGVTVGDFDQDGFPDIYLANIGPNRLYRNLGDGTFEDVTLSAGLRDDDWTTSCALADLNGDSLPDIYSVNYLTGEGVYTRTCESAGRVKSCLPTHFEPQQDRVWLNLGDGRFEEQTATALRREQFSGRGMGLVVARIEDDGLPNVLVANDTDPNFWQVNASRPGLAGLQFQDQGIASGLAFDGNGNPQASMGIAAGDADRDGRLDFFVTNFYREGSALYLQRTESVFEDRTRPAGLFEPSRLMLGFGTQFLDADADGWLDLVVANGHVYNNTHLGEPMAMPPQFFRNSGGGKFSEVPGSQLGSYFTGQYLGRSLVRWDWNRDGSPDIAVSHLDHPLAVLTNQSTTRFHNLVLSLRGVKSNREAIGAIVRVRAGKDNWMIPLTAGDGYQSSNDRRLMLGLGESRIAEEVTIIWPSGVSQRIADLATDLEYVVVEGKPPKTLLRPAGQSQLSSF